MWPHIGAGKVRPDLRWELPLEATPLPAWFHGPVMVDLDAPFEQLAHHFDLEQLVQAPSGEHEFIAPEALRHIGADPPELLHKRLVLGLCRSKGDIGSVRWWFPSSRLTIFVQQDPIACIQSVWQPSIGGDPLQQPHRPDAVVDLDTVFIEHAPPVRRQLVQLILIAGA
jgi:hypothetical protein